MRYAMPLPAGRIALRPVRTGTRSLFKRDHPRAIDAHIDYFGSRRTGGRLAAPASGQLSLPSPSHAVVPAPPGEAR